MFITLSANLQTTPLQLDSCFTVAAFFVTRQKTNNYLQNSTHKTKDRVTRTSLKTGNELMCSGRVSSSCSINDISLRAIDFDLYQIDKYWKEKL
jgi:hypothetical protein